MVSGDVSNEIRQFQDRHGISIDFEYLVKPMVFTIKIQWFFHELGVKKFFEYQWKCLPYVCYQMFSISPRSKWEL